MATRVSRHRYYFQISTPFTEISPLRPDTYSSAHRNTPSLNFLKYRVSIRPNNRMFGREPIILVIL